MKTCPACGNSYPDHFAACPVDGSALDSPPPPPPPPPMPGPTSWGAMPIPTPRKSMNSTVKVLLISGAVLGVLLVIFVLLAIPNISRAKRAANDSGALASMRAIYEAQIMYGSNYPSLGAACSLQALGGDAASGSATPTAAQLIAPDLATGIKNGYYFQVINCKRTTTGNYDRVTGYEIVATPQTVGSTGNRGFCMDENGRITTDPSGGTNCTQLVE